MEVREVCCDHLTSSDYATNQMKYVKRRTRFVFSSRWSAAKSGSPSIIQKGVSLSIVSDGPNYKLRMNGTLGRLQFGSVLEAKIKAFDLIDSGVAHAYFSTRKFRSDYYQKQ
jgi:hypothetical protein